MDLSTYKTYLKSSRDYCYPHWTRSIENYKHYLGKLNVGGIKESDYPFQSKMVIPISYEKVETVMPRIIGRDPEFTTNAFEEEDVPYEHTAKITVQSQYENPKLEILGEPTYLKLQRGTKEQLITGNVVYRAKWRREYRKMVNYLASLKETGHEGELDTKKILAMSAKIKENGGDGSIKWEPKLEKTAFLDDFDMEHKPFFYFMPDPEFPEPGKMRFKIEREVTTYKDLVDESTIFEYDKQAMEELTEDYESNKCSPPAIEGGAKDFLTEYSELFSNPDLNVNSKVSDKNQILIVDKVWEGDKVSVFVNEKYCLTPKAIKNPYHLMADPFMFGYDSVIPYSYFCYGEIDAIKKMEDGVTDIHNMRFDNVVQAMLGYTVYNPNMISQGDEFLPIPGSMTAVKDVDRAVRMFNPQDVTASAYKESEALLQLIGKITGVDDYVKGVEGDSLAGRSYGGMRLVQEAANARFLVKSRLFEKVTLKSLGYFILEFSRQFINKDRMVRIAGKGGEEKTREKLIASDLKQIKGFMDITVTPNSSMAVDQQAEAMKLNAVADRFSAKKGPFENIPDSVYDSFLLKYFQANGFQDAFYWIRLIKEARGKEGKGGEIPVKDQPPQPPATMPVQSAPMLQSNGVTNQPDPLDQMNLANTTLPTAPAMPPLSVLQ